MKPKLVWPTKFSDNDGPRAKSLQQLQQQKDQHIHAYRHTHRQPYTKYMKIQSPNDREFNTWNDSTSNETEFFDKTNKILAYPTIYYFLDLQNALKLVSLLWFFLELYFFVILSFFSLSFHVFFKFLLLYSRLEVFTHV